MPGDSFLSAFDFSGRRVLVTGAAQGIGAGFPTAPILLAAEIARLE